MRSLILISGRKRTGKGETYNTLCGLYNGVGEFFFAKPLKDFCIYALGLTYDQMYGDVNQRESLTKYKWGGVSEKIRNLYNKNIEDLMTAREVIQVIGTDVMRDNFYSDVWAEAGARAAIQSSNQTCVFTDCRMPNELLAIQKLAVDGIDFNKPVCIRMYKKTGLVDFHKTESSLDIYDAVNDQRSLEEGIPLGFELITTRLYRKITGGSPYDWLIDNNGTIEELRSNIYAICGTLDNGLVA